MLRLLSILTLSSFLIACSAGCGGYLNGPPASNRRLPYAVERTLKVTVNCDGEDIGGGSAVRLGHHAVLTAGHVTKDHEKCKFTGQDFAGHDLPLTYVLRGTGDVDAAVLAEEADLPVLSMVEPLPGEHVWAVGYPAQPQTGVQYLAVTDGVVVGTDPKDGTVQITNAIYFGNSGGGAWNDEGQLLGITVSSYTYLNGFTYIEPTSRLIKMFGDDVTSASEE